MNKKERELQKESGVLDLQYAKKERSKGNPEDILRFEESWWKLVGLKDECGRRNRNGR